jgi:hypothetical protein
MSEQKPLVRLRKKPQYEPIHHIKRAKVEDCINTFAHSVKFTDDTNKGYEIYALDSVEKYSCRDIAERVPILVRPEDDKFQLFISLNSFPLEYVEVVFKNLTFPLSSKAVVFGVGLINGVACSRAVYKINYDIISLLAIKPIRFINLIDFAEMLDKNHLTVLHYPSFRYLQVSLFQNNGNNESVINSNLNATY